MLAWDLILPFDLVYCMVVLYKYPLALAWFRALAFLLHQYFWFISMDPGQGLCFCACVYMLISFGFCGNSRDGSLEKLGKVVHVRKHALHRSFISCFFSTMDLFFSGLGGAMRWTFGRWIKTLSKIYVYFTCHPQPIILSPRVVHLQDYTCTCIKFAIWISAAYVCHIEFEHLQK